MTPPATACSRCPSATSLVSGSGEDLCLACLPEAHAQAQDVRRRARRFACQGERMREAGAAVAEAACVLRAYRQEIRRAPSVGAWVDGLLAAAMLEAAEWALDAERWAWEEA